MATSTLSCDTGQIGVEGLDLFHMKNLIAVITLTAESFAALQLELHKDEANKQGVMVFHRDAPALL